MVEPLPADYESELRISPRLVIVALVALGVALCIGVQLVALPEPALTLGLIVAALAGAAWVVSDRQAWAGRWFLALSLIAIIVLAYAWLEVPSLLVFLVVPTAVVAAMIGIPAATAATVIQTVLLVILWRQAPTDVTRASADVALVAIWAVLGVMVAAYQPVRQLAGWSWEHYQRAGVLLAESRADRAKLKQALDDLALAYRQLAMMNDRVSAARAIAEEAQKAKSAFVAQVSHEFRTPLNMIIGLTDLLVESPGVYGRKLPAALLEDLEIVHRNCEHLASMINDVLDLSQVEADRLALHKERYDLREVIDKAVTVVRPLIDKKGLTLQISVPDDLPQVYCDRTRIRQVILNLVSNAARYTEQGGLVVRATADGQYVTISVADTGPGIAQEEATRIFEPFFQGTPPQGRTQGGSGLGLNVSKQFVELHGGQMWFESEPGHGSVFSFKLPISPPIELVTRPSSWLVQEWMWHERTSQAALPVGRAKPRVVICDETGELFPLLERYANEIEFADTRSLAQAKIEARGYATQALLLNVTDANDLLPLVRQATAEVSDTPVIGCSMPPRAERALAAGALAFLPKPLTRRAVSDTIQKIGRPVRRVLIVEDEDDARRLFARILHTLDNTLELAFAATSQEALDDMRTHHPDLVLLDIVLSDSDGWQMLATKRAEEAIRDVPVVIVSGQDPRERPV
ncbi:MAG: response regulator, partial [Anaerolineae bacterium]|nr:response regulator [Anaerolineae bacterium]